MAQKRVPSALLAQAELKLNEMIDDAVPVKPPVIVLDFSMCDFERLWFSVCRLQ